MSAPLRLAVVGHVNTGKTSLIATLARRPDLAIADGRTTLGLQEVVVEADGRAVLVLVDTPGFELVGDIDEELARRRGAEREAGRRPDELELLRAFVADAKAAGRADLALDLRALEAALEADAILVVIDVTQEPLERLRDEVSLLTRTARPVVGVLNFVAEGETHEEAWRDVLRRERVHAVAAFDVMVEDAASEAELLRTIETVVPPERRRAVAAVGAAREGARAEARRSAVRATAELLLSAATLSVSEERERDGAAERARRRLEDDTRELERRCFSEIARGHGFTGSEVRADSDAKASADVVEEDLFDPAAWQRHAPGLLGLAAGGAAAGAAVDALVGGLSLGAGALLGGAAGLATGVVRRAVRVKARGHLVTARLSPELAWLLLGRAVACHEAYARRTHARRDVETLSETPLVKRPGAKETIEIVRRAAQDESLQEGDASPRRRAECLAELQSELARVLR